MSKAPSGGNGGKLYLRNDTGTVHDLTVGAGATSLGGLSDVTLGGITLAAGHILVYDGSGAFLNKLVAGATGTTATLTAAGELGITALTALTDLDLTAGNKTIFDTIGANTLTIGASNTTVAIAGDLTVAGTTTTVNSTTITVADPIFNVGGNSAPGSDDNKDRGMSFR